MLNGDTTYREEAWMKMIAIVDEHKFATRFQSRGLITVECQFAIGPRYLRKCFTYRSLTISVLCGAWAKQSKVDIFNINLHLIIVVILAQISK